MTLKVNKEVKEEDVKRVIYHQGKRMIKKKVNKKKVVGTILVIGIIVFLIVRPHKDESHEENISNTSSEQVTNKVETNSVSEEEKKYENVDIPETLGGYDVLGQLVIEKIGVRQNVLSKTESGSLKLGVTKFYPPQVNINEPGNFCICGHNWNNILKRLDEMNVGEQFYLITRETKERIDYEIYDKYSCEPTDLSCLDQNQDGKKEVTLITCNPGGLTRLICKAREV